MSNTQKPNASQVPNVLNPEVTPGKCRLIYENGILVRVERNPKATKNELTIPRLPRNPR